MIAFYNTKNHRFVAGFNYEKQEVTYYDKNYQDHIRIFDSISSEVVPINWNMPSYIIPVEIPIDKFKECLKGGNKK